MTAIQYSLLQFKLPNTTTLNCCLHVYESVIKLKSYSYDTLTWSILHYEYTNFDTLSKIW